MMLYQLKSCLKKMSVNGQYGGIRKEPVVAYLKVLYHPAFDCTY